MGVPRSFALFWLDGEAYARHATGFFRFWYFGQPSPTVVSSTALRHQRLPRDRLWPASKAKHPALPWKTWTSLQLLDFVVARDYHDAVASRDLKYSNLIVLTGAGASKPCGLPDMLEFAEQFRQQEVGKSGAGSSESRLVNAILGEKEPKADLEALMTTLMSLSGDGNDAAVDLLLEKGADSESELTSALENTSAALDEWLTRVPYGDGPFDVVVGGLKLIDPKPGDLILSDPKPGDLILQPQPEDRFSVDSVLRKLDFDPTPDPDLVQRLLSGSGIGKDAVEGHRKSATRARRVIEKWRDFFSSTRPTAKEILQRLKEQIQINYSKYNLDRASSVYWPLFKELLPRYSYVDIFTLNYDTIIEGVLAANQRQCSTGFTTTGDRAWADSFPKGTPSAESVRLFKLHGSVNWFKLETNINEMPPLVTGVTTPTGQAQSMLIYPITHKVTYDEPHLTLLHHFSRGLRAAEFCLIIGCSLRDDFVSSALVFAARDRRALHFIFCGAEARISSNPWLSRFRKRFTVMEHRFGAKGFLPELKAILDR